MDRNHLRVYQDRAVDWVKDHRQSGLFLDMGLGKTVVTLTAIVDLLDADELTGPVVLIGPIRVIKLVWEQEAQKWSHTRHLRFSLVHGSPKAREKALAAPADIYMINPENTKWLVDWLEQHEEFQVGLLVVDESSAYKDSTTQRFKAIRRIVSRIRRRLILTGTPTPNSLMELWPQLFILDSGKRLGTSFYRFRQRFFEPLDYQGWNWGARKGAEDYIYRLVGDVVMRLDAKDWLELPPVINNYVRVQLPPDAMRLYKHMERDMVLKLTGGESEAVNAAVLTMKCQQIANGALYVEDAQGQNRTAEFIHDAKVEALQDILGEAGAPVLVVYVYQHDLARLKAALPKAPVLTETKDVNKLVREWNEGKHPVMLIHPGSAGHGLNLQYGGNRIVFFSLTWSLEQHDQVFERIGPARQVGLAPNVIRYYIVAEDTVDEAIMRALQTKAKGQKALLDILRAQLMTPEELLS